jgi:hypothetical protein
MTSIKMTAALRKAINAAVRANTNGFSPFAEVGLRESATTGLHNLPNALHWTDDGDLGDLVPLRDLREINGYDAAPGCAELDLYVTSGSGNDRELETNVCVLIRDGAVVGATPDGRNIAALKARLNFPAGNGW